MAKPSNMFAEERKHHILQVLDQGDAVRVSDLSRVLRVSEASVRRDLSDLAEAGLLKRTHGGAIGPHAGAYEPSSSEKDDRYRAEKAAIARMAADMVQDGEVILLDAGSTTLAIARLLKSRRNLTVVTNSLSVASELASSRVEVLVAGGSVRPPMRALVGPVAEAALADLHADRLFLGANGVDLRKGVTTPNLVEAQTKRAMVESAREVVVVADHSKAGRVTFSRVCSLDRVSALITDDAAPPTFIQALENQGVKVYVAAIRAGRVTPIHGRAAP
jgi:DeoR family fructose operon transcriptional repressor